MALESLSTTRVNAEYTRIRNGKIPELFGIKKRCREDDDRPSIVISCFDLTGALVKPWADAGFGCHIVDVQHPKGMNTEGNVTKWGMDVYEWEKVFFTKYTEKVMRVVFAAFSPPCTDLAVSGARWFEKKEQESPGTRKRAMDLVHWSDRIGRKLGCPYFVENPVSVISSEWRAPNFWFHPYEYGGYAGGKEDGYTKKTCLWTGGGFQLPPKKPIKLDPHTCERIWRMAPSPERQNLRSKTPQGYAQAVFETHDPRCPRETAKRFNAKNDKHRLDDHKELGTSSH